MSFRCIAGMDVHKKMLAVWIRREADGQAEYLKRKFGTMRSEIEHGAEIWKTASYPGRHKDNGGG